MAGKASTIRNAVTSVIHVKTGRRIIVRPGARMLMMVVMKLSEAAIEATPSSCRPMTHMSIEWLGLKVRVVSGVYPNQPPFGTPSCRNQPMFRMIAPARKTQNEKALSRGKATSLAPICSGMMKLKNAALRGMIARKIMVVACIVNISLYCCAERKLLFGTASWMRMNRASSPPTRKKNRADIPYRKPIRLWSTVVSQLTRPVLAVGRQRTRGRAAVFSSLPRKSVLTSASAMRWVNSCFRAAYFRLSRKATRASSSSGVSWMWFTR